MQDQINLTKQALQGFIESGDLHSAKFFEEQLIKQGQQPISVNTEIVLLKFITADAKLLQLKEDVRSLAFANEPVLITGETGTGKELIAQALHGRRQGKFEAINCAAIPETLLESELFGYKKGAFTGADTDKVGLFLAANNGTIFLDEVGEMPAGLQSKLLRVIQESRIRPLGHTGPEIGIKTRIVCATNKNLMELCSNRLFRLDLYYRLSIFELHIDPLRERTFNDIELIAKSLEGGDEFWKKHGETIKHGLETKKVLLEGNVRELQRMVKRYKVLGHI